MNLDDLYEEPFDQNHDLAADHTKITAKDLRKSRLTLKQINRMRRIIDLRQFEQKAKLQLIQLQYSKPPEQGPGL